MLLTFLLSSNKVVKRNKCTIKEANNVFGLIIRPSINSNNICLFRNYRRGNFFIGLTMSKKGQTVYIMDIKIILLSRLK